MMSIRGKVCTFTPCKNILITLLMHIMLSYFTYSGKIGLIGYVIASQRCELLHFIHVFAY